MKKYTVYQEGRKTPISVNAEEYSRNGNVYFFMVKGSVIQTIHNVISVRAEEIPLSDAEIIAYLKEKLSRAEGMAEKYKDLCRRKGEALSSIRSLAHEVEFGSRKTALESIYKKTGEAYSF
jgi:hypothetical protein